MIEMIVAGIIVVGITAAFAMSPDSPAQADNVDTGKVRFMFKDYPINDLSDRASSLAAEASY